MKCSTVAMMIAAFGLVQLANAFNSHPKDDMPLRRRRQLHDDGGHVSIPLEMRLGVMERVNSWVAQHPDRAELEQTGSSLRRLSSPKTKYKVDVRFVQIKANSTVKTIALKAYKESLRQVNRDYRGSGFTFRLAETPRVVVDEESYDCNLRTGREYPVGQLYRQGNATMLNVFLCDCGPKTLGYAFQPFYLPTGEEYFAAVDAVYLNPTYLNLFNTLTHEIGHWLGLDHTDYNDCEFPGDGVDDTPYHLKPPGPTNVSCDAVLDTCPNKPGFDPIDNFMSYAKSCGKSFTKGQINRMRAVYESFRLNLAETDACRFEVDLQFDDKPEQVTVFVQYNHWYDYLVVNGTEYMPNGTYTIESYFTEGEGSLTIQDTGGDGMGSAGSVSLYLLDGNSNRYLLASVLGSSVKNITTVDFTVPSGCKPATAPTRDPWIRRCDPRMRNRTGHYVSGLPCQP